MSKPKIQLLPFVVSILPIGVAPEGATGDNAPDDGEHEVQTMRVMVHRKGYRSIAVPYWAEAGAILNVRTISRSLVAEIRTDGPLGRRLRAMLVEELPTRARKPAARAA